MASVTRKEETREGVIGHYCSTCGAWKPDTKEYYRSNGTRADGVRLWRAACHTCEQQPKLDEYVAVSPIPREHALTLTDENVRLLLDVEAQRGNLTSMWRASGESESRAPGQWLRTEGAKEFVRALSETVKNPFETRRGGIGSETWAHWQICVEYARYLSPAFAIRWNDYARRYLEQQTNRPAPQPITMPSPLSGIAQARSMAAHVAQKANEFLQALDMAGRRGVEFGDAMQHASPEVAGIVQAMPELTHPRKAGFVYLTREPNDRRSVYKVGKSADAEKREGQIPGQMPTVVRNVKVIRTDDCTQLENDLKTHFKAQRFGKEWYRLSDQQVAAICDLPDYFPSTRFRELSVLLATEQIVQGALSL